jgi:hypothetical protein
MVTTASVYSQCSGIIVLLISVSRLLYQVKTSITYLKGFISGKAKQLIPWGAVEASQYAWISKECIPDGFKWKDPSHIKIGEVWRLLYHWRDRQDQGLDPLIWLPTCPVLQGIKGRSKQGRNLRLLTDIQPQDSEEEIFDLPAGGDSDEVDEESDEHCDANKSADDSPVEGYSSEDGESIDLDMDSPHTHMSDPEHSSG